MLKVHFLAGARHLLAVVLLLPILAVSACDDVVRSDDGPIGGTYTGSANVQGATVSYHLTLPETATTSFEVAGTVEDGGREFEVKGTGIYDHPNIYFELVPLDGNVEDVFGVSAKVNSDDATITTLTSGKALVLHRN